MQITVEYAAQIKRAAGRASETLDFNAPCNVQDVLNRVVEQHGESLKELLFTGEDQIHPSILLFVGDSQVRGDEPRQLTDQDCLTILSPISGG